ncbi:hypothetical protein [Aliivibrio fischeri]|uniref:hypothetical protein n=1 Tax=Aliivibrio fischeri TaxID=668 RepID=UPI00030B6BD5|nr:hypothetical protein [Aliivibrio fischeri]OEE17112.1 hypothetical protein A1Q3_16875 [Aliivibrio fischeri ZF-211]
MRLLLVLVGLVLFLSVTLLSLHLLQLQLVTGGEFTAIFIAFAIISLLIPLLPEVQNFSIAGNSVTFKEVKEEAHIALCELKNAQIDTMRWLLISVTKQSSGMKALNSVFLESKNFWKLHEKIAQHGYESQLSIDILATLEDLLHSYMFLFVNSSDKAKEAFSVEGIEFPNPSQVIDILISDTNLKHKNFVTEGLSDYQKLYDLNNHLNKKI